METSFYFDPMCPWTWMTSRWLVDVAARRGVAITWRSFSLALLNEGKEYPPELLAAVPDLPARHRIGLQILRIVEALHEAGRNDDIGRFYTECGLRFHVRQEPPEPGVLEDAAKAAGVEDRLPAGAEDGWDRLLRASLEEALVSAGPDIGSPVLVVEGSPRGAFGPIVNPPPEGEDAVRLWDAVVTLQSIPTFFEVKRGRTGPPAIPGGA